MRLMVDTKRAVAMRPTALSLAGKVYKVGKDGSVSVPDADAKGHADELRGHGFVEVAESEASSRAEG